MELLTMTCDSKKPETLSSPKLSARKTNWPQLSTCSANDHATTAMNPSVIGKPTSKRASLTSWTPIGKPFATVLPVPPKFSPSLLPKQRPKRNASGLPPKRPAGITPNSATFSSASFISPFSRPSNPLLNSRSGTIKLLLPAFGDLQTPSARNAVSAVANIFALNENAGWLLFANPSRETSAKTLALRKWSTLAHRRPVTTPCARASTPAAKKFSVRLHRPRLADEQLCQVTSLYLAFDLVFAGKDLL